MHVAASSWQPKWEFCMNWEMHVNMCVHKFQTETRTIKSGRKLNGEGNAAYVDY